MKCPKCNSQVLAEDVNVQALIAKCRECHEVFSFAEEIADSGADQAEEELRVPQPEKLRVEDDGVTRRITRRWFSPVFFFLIFFCVIWDGFLVFWYSMASAAPGGIVDIFFLVFPILHVAVGVGLTYFTICGFVNRTIIEVTDAVLTVRRGPLPWPGNHRVPAGDIIQLYCDETVSRGKNSTNVTFNVHAMLSAGRSVKLLSGLPEKSMALFIEQQLEDWLAIRPRRVKGAMN